jgi:hypothetical protein
MRVCGRVLRRKCQQLLRLLQRSSPVHQQPSILHACCNYTVGAVHLKCTCHPQCDITSQWVGRVLLLWCGGVGGGVHRAFQAWNLCGGGGGVGGLAGRVSCFGSQSTSVGLGGKRGKGKGKRGKGKAGDWMGWDGRVLLFVHEAGCDTHRVTEVTPSHHDGSFACVTDADNNNTGVRGVGCVCWTGLQRCVWGLLVVLGRLGACFLDEFDGSLTSGGAQHRSTVWHDWMPRPLLGGHHPCCRTPAAGV